MIKRIRFVTRLPQLSAAEFAARWPSAAAAGSVAPQDIRPSRMAVCTSVPELAEDVPRHDGVGLEWFRDTAHLESYERWLGSAGRLVRERLARVAAVTDSPVVIAEEHVLRGPEWLAQRWRSGGGRYKHMALAVRANGLSPAEFSRRWRGHSGAVGGGPAAPPPTVLPDSVRGYAYVQNHPVPVARADWAYDAVNEVYFDDPDALRGRIEWFRANLGDRADDLVSRSWFLAVREELVLGQ